MDKRIGELQIESVEIIGAKQTAERETSSLKLRMEREQTEYKMEIERLQSEIASVRSRLKFAEDAVVAGRKQNLQLVEAVASLETDVVNEKHRRETAEKRRAEEIAKERQDKNDQVDQIRNEQETKEKRLRKENDKLQDLIKRQRTIIAELKSQCLDVTSKFEESYNSWKKEKDNFVSDIRKLNTSLSDLQDQKEILDNQNREHTKLHEHLLNQIGYLEDTNRIQEEKIKRINEDDNYCHYTSSHSEKKTKVNSRRTISAIKIERVGKVKNVMATVD